MPRTKTVTAPSVKKPRGGEALPPLGHPIDLGFLRNRAGHLFRRSFNYHYDQLNALLAPADLSVATYAILAVIHHNPGAAPSDVADALLIARANFVLVLDALEQRKLVVRRARPDDRRYRALYLTKPGQALFDELEPQVLAFENELMKELNQKFNLTQELTNWMIKKGIF